MQLDCSVPECLRPAQKRGMCNLHYRRVLRYGDPHTLKRPQKAASRVCAVAGCDRPHHAKDLCAMHDGRLRYHGDALAGGRARLVNASREERFANFVDRRGADECWYWTASVTPNGYGQFCEDGRRVTAHRVALEIATGQRPADGLDVDHLCHNRDQSCAGGPSCPHRRCCNPAHLEAVTHAENVRRGKRFSRTGPDVPFEHRRAS